MFYKTKPQKIEVITFFVEFNPFKAVTKIIAKTYNKMYEKFSSRQTKSLY